MFWPVLAVVLAVSVVFVASTAHRSMDSVGVLSTVGSPLARPSARLSPAASTGSLTIVQVSSHPGRGAAEAARQRLLKHHFPARVLHSDDFQPLNPGYYVVYVGPYPTTAQGHTQARRAQAKLPGAIIRDVRRH